MTNFERKGLPIRSYPLVSGLPDLIDTRNWKWKPFVGSQSAGYGFFVGTDETGTTWLTKTRGTFYGYREIVFERLVQRAGWLSQSSTFSILAHFPESRPRTSSAFNL